MDEKNESQAITPEVINALPVKSQSKMTSLRDQKIREHYGEETLAEKMRSEDISVDSLLRDLLVELARETDNLAGNRALADENGEIERSTVISTKRAEMITQTIKTIMAKKEFEATNSIDVDSPSMRIVFKYFIEKCKESFQKAGLSQEISEVFFRNLTELCSDWKKELRRKIAELKT